MHVILTCFLLSAAGSDLERGIKLFNDFEDAKAEAVLREYLKTSPLPQEAAKTHLYLGLIAFNGLESEKARQEFTEAIKIIPSIELPFGVSPKVRFLFEQVQRQTIEQEAYAKTPVGRPRTGTEARGPPPPPPSRAPAYIVGAIGLAAVAAGGIMGALSSSDLNTSTNTSIVVNTANDANARAGTEGLTADILFAAGGAIVLTGIILWFVEAPGDAAPSVGVSGSAQGASVLLSGRF